MNDRILESYVRDFSDQYGLENLPQHIQFSNFVNHSVISCETSEFVAPNEINVDGGQSLFTYLPEYYS